MNPQVLLLQSSVNNTLPLPNSQEVSFNPSVVKRNSLDAASFSNGTLTAKRTGYFSILASAEAEKVSTFHVGVRTPSGDYYARGFASVNADGNADKRIQCVLSKVVFLNEGETAGLFVKQEGSSTANLWPYPDTVFAEVEYLGY